MKKWMYSLLIIFVILLISGYGLLNTSLGVHLGIKLIKTQLPGTLQVEQVSGRLLDHITIKKINYQQTGTHLSLNQFQAHWNLWHVISGHLQIKAQWQSLQAIAAGQQINTQAGTLHVAGTREHYQVQGNTIMRINQQTPIPWSIQGQGNLQQLQIEPLQATWKNSNIKLQGTIQWSPQLRWKLTLKSQKMNLNDFHKNIQGFMNLHLSTQGEMANQLKVSVKLHNATGQINHLPFHATGELEYQPKHILLHQINFNLGTNRIHINGQLQQQWQIHWNANLPKLQIFDPKLKGQVTLQGKITGPINTPHVTSKLSAQQLNYHDIKSPQLNATLNYTLGKPGQLVVDSAQISQGEQIIRHLKAHLNWHQQQQRLVTQLKLTAEGIPPLTGQVDFPNFLQQPTITQQAIQGQLNTKLNDLSFVPKLLPQLDHVKGQLTTNIHLSGTIGKPKWQGYLSLTHGQTAIKTLGITLHDVNASIKTDKSGNVQYQAQLKSGDGHLSLKGNTQLSQAKHPTELHLKGKSFLLMNNREANLIVDPNITVNSSGPQINVSGTVFIPKARVTPDDFTTTETLPRDVVFVDEKQSKSSPLLITSRIHLILGDEVRFAYSGLNAKIGGDLELRDHTTGITTASGQLSIREGRFTAYGQNLKINRGQLVYAGGPVTNPSINIEAVKQVRIMDTSEQSDGKKGKTLATNDVTVGVQVTGTVEQPHLTLFSHPSNLSQSDILSYLVLGRSTSNLSKGDASILFSALPLLSSGKNDSSLTKQQLEHKLGFNVNISSEQAYDEKKESVVENTSLVLGKSLSPKLFIDYGIGLVKPINTFHVGYKITPKLVIRTETSTNANGIDVLYSFEKD